MTEPPQPPLIAGHCLCGQVRYRATMQPLFVGYCHCPDCRRATGGVVAPYAGFQEGALVFEGTPPARFVSPSGGTRTFCGTCGTPVTYQSALWPGEIHLLVGSVEDPSGLKPTAHVFCRHRVPWFEIADNLRRYDTYPSPSGT